MEQIGLAGAGSAADQTVVHQPVTQAKAVDGAGAVHADGRLQTAAAVALPTLRRRDGDGVKVQASVGLLQRRAGGGQTAVGLFRGGHGIWLHRERAPFRDRSGQGIGAIQVQDRPQTQQAVQCNAACRRQAGPDLWAPRRKRPNRRRRVAVRRNMQKALPLAFVETGRQIRQCQHAIGNRGGRVLGVIGFQIGVDVAQAVLYDRGDMVGEQAQLVRNFIGAYVDPTAA